MNCLIRKDTTLLLGWLLAVCLVPARAILEEASPEQLYRQTVSQWYSIPGNGPAKWKPWSNFADAIWDRFESQKGASPSSSSAPLELVGAMEEGILAIERIVFQQGEGDNPIRDSALSQLYTTYSRMLLELSPESCLQLALDPHTLLIGADAVDRTKPSNEICHENAENSLRNAATLDANNQQAHDLLQKLTGEDTVHKRKPKEFVEELFDSFANSFDEKLLHQLEYKVPFLVGNLTQQLVTQHKKDEPKYHAILDAGCGTGLAGRYVRPFLDVDSGVMVGVDASQKMLDKAAACTLQTGCGSTTEEVSGEDPPLYEGLLQMDLEDMSLANTIDTIDSRNGGEKKSTAFDLIVAADVFVYFGSLEVILVKLGKLALPKCHLIFTTELADPDEAPLGFRLLGSGRFAHTKQHAIDAAKAAGFEPIFYEPITPRMEKGEPVRGQLFGFEFSPSTEQEL